MKSYVIVNNSTDMLYLTRASLSGYDIIYKFTADISADNVLILNFNDALNLYNELKNGGTKQFEQIKMHEIIMREVDANKHLYKLNKFNDVEKELTELSKIINIKREMFEYIEAKKTLTFDMNMVAAAEYIIRTSIANNTLPLDNYLHNSIVVFKDASCTFDVNVVKSTDNVFKIDANMISLSKLMRKHMSVWKEL